MQNWRVHMSQRGGARGGEVGAPRVSFWGAYRANFFSDGSPKKGLCLGRYTLKERSTFCKSAQQRKARRIIEGALCKEGGRHDR